MQSATLQHRTTPQRNFTSLITVFVGDNGLLEIGMYVSTKTLINHNWAGSMKYSASSSRFLARQSVIKTGTQKVVEET